jgi:ADP-ribose pyrophosphatase YjhB (NUDIX family)
VENELGLSGQLRFHEYVGDDHRHDKRRSHPAYVHAYTRKEKAFTYVRGKEQTMDEHARLVAEMFYLRVRESAVEVSNR